MRKDIRGYFYSFSKCSASSIAASRKDISNSDSEDSDEEPVTKNPCHSSSSENCSFRELPVLGINKVSFIFSFHCQHAMGGAKGSNE